jgi:hypothetical protein
LGAVLVLVDCLLYGRVFLYIAKQHPFRFAVMFQSDLARIDIVVASPSRLEVMLVWLVMFFSLVENQTPTILLYGGVSE